MTPDDVLKALYEETMVGNAPAVLEHTNTGLEIGMTPSSLLFDALIQHSKRWERASSAVTSSCRRC